jgi:hypothetical protein
VGLLFYLLLPLGIWVMAGAINAGGCILRVNGGAFRPVRGPLWRRQPEYRLYYCYTMQVFMDIEILAGWVFTAQVFLPVGLLLIIFTFSGLTFSQKNS